MQINDLADIREPYNHVYIAPHIDDAALSCGGAIVLQREAGERVLVVTLSTAAPAPDSAFSELAQEFHQIWQLSPAEAMAARKREDVAALTQLDADYHWAEMLDAIYRHPEAYNSRESLFGTPAPNDPSFAALETYIAKLREQFPQATFYAPLGVGSHVDHLITHTAVRKALGDNVVFYEDLPYAIVPGALDQRLAELSDGLTPHITAIDGALSTKLAAIHAYASQLDELFGGADAMVQAMTAYARSVRPASGEYGERVWRVAVTR